MKKYLLALMMLWLAQSAGAVTGCQEFDASKSFNPAFATVANNVKVTSNWNRIPYGNSFTVEIPSLGTMPLYVKAFARRIVDPTGTVSTNGTAANAEPMEPAEITELRVVSASRGNDALNMTLLLDRPATGWGWFSDTYDVVFLGCSGEVIDDTPGADDKMALILSDATPEVINAADNQAPPPPVVETQPSQPPELLLIGTGMLTFSTSLSGQTWAAGALAIAVAVIGMVAWLFGKSADGWWRGLKLAFSGLHYHVSLSKFQLVVFSVTIFVTLAYAFGRTRGLTDLSRDVLLLLGISATSATLATVSDRFRSRLSWENWVWLAKTKKAMKGVKEAELTWFDLVRTNGEFDVNRFQALVFTILVAPAFAIMFVYSLDTATIPAGILTVLGLSQATYIAGKLTAPPTMQEFDAQVSRYREWEEEGIHITQKEADQLMNGFEGAMEYAWQGDKLTAVAGSPKPVS